MNRIEQCAFVHDLAMCIVDEIKGMIDDGNVPEYYDGHELRVWMSDKFKDAARLSLLRRHPHSQRNKDFRHWKAKTPGA